MNKKKLKEFKQLPYLVSNIAEILENKNHSEHESP